MDTKYFEHELRYDGNNTNAPLLLPLITDAWGFFLLTILQAIDSTQRIS